MENTYKGLSTFSETADVSAAQTWGFVIFGGTNFCILDWGSLLGFGALWIENGSFSRSSSKI